MNEVVIVRCVGCGTPNPTYVGACASCGTLLPKQAAALPIEPLTATASGNARVGGVARLFLAMLLLWVGVMVADKAGVPDTTADIAQAILIGLLAVGCVAAAWTDLGPLLARTGGLRGAAFAVVAFGIIVGFNTAYFALARRLGFTIVDGVQSYPAAAWPRAMPFLMNAVCPGIFEELLFRGYVMARLDRVLTARETLVVQAALFWMLHISVVILPSHLLIGLVLGVLRRRTGSLYPGMAVHMGWNGLVLWTGT